MPGPVVNLDEVVFDDVETNGCYTSRRACFSASIGARQLGYNLTELPPGKAQCPFHSHRAEEEMFLILEGEGELRFGERRYPIRRHDVIACPTGGPEVAHQIVNTGHTVLRYLAVSTMADVEICEYPDSGKVGLFASAPGTPRLRALHRTVSAVDYYDGESTSVPGGPS
ncbi:MAG TPA: cupin domain-containing protein [Piscinibacter sp.]|nr:cupin domain-containing protein [Piscinibacter sp.]